MGTLIVISFKAVKPKSAGQFKGPGIIPFKFVCLTFLMELLLSGTVVGENPDHVCWNVPFCLADLKPSPADNNLTQFRGLQADTRH